MLRAPSVKIVSICGSIVVDGLISASVHEQCWPCPCLRS
jgi:hypothetical protein